MHSIQRQRTADLLKSRGIDRALFSHIDSVKWLTGIALPIQLGTHTQAGGPPLVWYEDGDFQLILLDAHASDTTVFPEPVDIPVHSYEGYTIQHEIQSALNLRDILRDIVGHSSSSVACGVELETLPADLFGLLASLLPKTDLRAIDRWLVPLRMVKTEDEIARLRRNFQLTDLGHATVRETLEAGQREIDVWMAVHSAINREAGYRIPLGNDCVVGYRDPNNIGAWPLDLPTRAGSGLIVDLSTCWQGYWSDSCATYYVAEMTERQAAMHRTVREALDFAASLLKPGAIASEIDAQVRAFMQKAGYPIYPHHTGHGVGASVHEEPRIVPYNDTPLEPGMVIMLEPGIYYPGETGTRMEDAFLITGDGAQQLTTHLDH